MSHFVVVQDAARAIQNVNDTYIDGRFLKYGHHDIFGFLSFCNNVCLEHRLAQQSIAVIF